MKKTAIFILNSIFLILPVFVYAYKSPPSYSISYIIIMWVVVLITIFSLLLLVIFGINYFFKKNVDRGDKVLNIIKIIYFTIIIALPFVTYGGWVLNLFGPFIIAACLALGIFVFSTYKKQPEIAKKWIYLFLFIYILSCLFVVDGGDNGSRIGFETLFLYFSGSHETFVPEEYNQIFYKLWVSLLALFYILNIGFLFFYNRKSIKNMKNEVSIRIYDMQVNNKKNYEEIDDVSKKSIEK